MSFHSALMRFSDPDAVAITESDEIETDEAISLVRSHCTSPLVLFRNETGFAEPNDFNMVIQPLADPRVWLNDLVELIEKSRALCFASRSLQQQAVLLSDELSEARKKLRKERERSRQFRECYEVPDPYKQR